MSFIIFAEEKPAQNDNVKKESIPAATQLKDAEKNIRDIFKAEYAKTENQDKIDLARKLFAQADEAKDDSATRFELRALAGQLAAQTGDLDFALLILARLEGEFEGDLKELKKSILSAISASRTKNPALSKIVAAYSVLIEKPDDPAANLTLGYRECFVNGNWSTGFAMLSKSSNLPLRALIEKDNAGSDDGPAQLALGDAWWELGEKETSKDFKALYQERGAFWYRRAAQNLTGLQKIKNQKRILVAENASAALLAPPVKAPQTQPNLAPVLKKPLDTVMVTTADWLDGKPWSGHVFKVEGKLDVKNVMNKTVEAGAEIFSVSTGAFIYAPTGSKLWIQGKSDNPVLVQHLDLIPFADSQTMVTSTEFNEGQLSVMKVPEKPLTTRFRNCVFNKLRFSIESDTAIATQFCNCLFVGADFMPASHSTVFIPPAPGNPAVLTGCILMNCTVRASVFLSSMDCSYIGCKFVGDYEISGKSDMEIRAYLLSCSGNTPVGTKERKVKLLKAASPYPSPLLPVPAIPVMSPLIRQALDLGKGYRWISKDATYTVSSVSEKDVPSPKLLNGEGDAYNMTHSFASKLEDSPYICIDLGKRHAVTALEIENRFDFIEHADTLTAFVSDSANGPWNEIWQTAAAQAQWILPLDHAYPCRFIKLGLKKKEILSLNQVRIFER